MVGAEKVGDFVVQHRQQGGGRVLRQPGVQGNLPGLGVAAAPAGGHPAVAQGGQAGKGVCEIFQHFRKIFFRFDPALQAVQLLQGFFSGFRPFQPKRFFRNNFRPLPKPKHIGPAPEKHPVSLPGWQFQRVAFLPLGRPGLPSQNKFRLGLQKCLRLGLAHPPGDGKAHLPLPADAQVQVFHCLPGEGIAHSLPQQGDGFLLGFSVLLGAHCSASR